MIRFLNSTPWSKTSPNFPPLGVDIPPKVCIETISRYILQNYKLILINDRITQFKDMRE